MRGRPKLIKNAKSMFIYIDEEIETKIKKDAQKQGMSTSQLVRKIINEYYLKEKMNI